MSLENCLSGNTSYCADCRGENNDVCLSVTRKECLVYDEIYRDKDQCLSLKSHSYRPDTESCLKDAATNFFDCLEPCRTLSPLFLKQTEIQL